MLEKREKRPHSTTLYRVACEEILKFGHMIPDQMLALYKARDMNEVICGVIAMVNCSLF